MIIRRLYHTKSNKVQAKSISCADFYKKFGSQEVFVDNNATRLLLYSWLPNIDIIEFYFDRIAWAMKRPSGSNTKTRIYFKGEKDFVELKPSGLEQYFEHFLDENFYL